MQCRMFFYLQYNTTTLHLLNSIEQRGEQHATHEDIYCQFFVCAVPSYMYTGAFFQVWAGDLRLPVLQMVYFLDQQVLMLTTCPA